MKADADIRMPDAIRRIADNEDRELAWCFFVFFSRFEYALKRCRRYLTEDARKNARANWDRFARDHAPDFDSRVCGNLQVAVEYFRANPPRRQLRSDGKMSWSDPQRYDGNEALLIWLLRMIRCVRNNLFHGGKFPVVPITDPSRDRQLLRNSLVVLTECLHLDREVRDHVSDRLD